MFKCLAQSCFRDQAGYQLVPVRQQDVESIRQWRNAQIEVLRQNEKISFQEQQTYFEQHVWPTFHQERPKQLLFSLLLEQECIGYGGLTNLEWSALRAEVSFLVVPERAYQAEVYVLDFTHFLRLLYRVAFEELHLHRLWSETYAFRHQIIYVLEEMGFKREGLLREHVFKRGAWQDAVIHGLLCTEVKYKSG